MRVVVLTTVLFAVNVVLLVGWMSVRPCPPPAPSPPPLPRAPPCYPGCAGNVLFPTPNDNASDFSYLAPSDTWIEVARHKLCSHRCEGRSQGVWHSNDYGAQYESIEPIAVSMDAKVPYGCRFLHAPGSSIWLNVRRSLLVRDFGHAKEVLGLPTWAGDRLFCTRAIRLGYDSIQINSGHGNWRELIYCTGGSQHETICGGCVPAGVPLRDGNNQTCACQPANNLNCGCRVIYPANASDIPRSADECNTARCPET